MAKTLEKLRICENLMYETARDALICKYISSYSLHDENPLKLNFHLNQFVPPEIDSNMTSF